MNVRVWKANASEQLGTLLPRERKRQQYNAALVERHKHLPGENWVLCGFVRLRAVTIRRWWSGTSTCRSSGHSWCCVQAA